MYENLSLIMFFVNMEWWVGWVAHKILETARDFLGTQNLESGLSIVKA